MNDLHTKILTLIKEIDAICRKYDITYYTAGGTTIGAVRHHGFIPWDDDIDIYMTRSEFYKFREAFKLEKPAGRALECLDDNPEYPGTIPRYIDTTTTDLCRFHCMNTCAGGIIIDIFILDPVPADPVKQDEYRAKLNIYAEFTMPYYAFSYRNDTQYLELYYKYKEIEEKNGRAAVLQSLEKDIFTYPEEECAYYMLRWATLPSIFPKEMFGEPVYFPFENMELPLPYKWCAYLKQLYGADWMYVPQNVENQVQHITVVNTEISYPNYTKELDVFIDKESALRVYNRRKENLLQREIMDRPFKEMILEKKAKAISESVNQSLQQCSCELDEMKQRHEYVKILQIFDKYMLEQLSATFAGKMKHGDWYRYKNPVFIELEDKTLAVLIYSLIAINEVKKAERLLEIRRKSGTKETELLAEVRDLISRIDRLYRLYYSKQFEKAYGVLEQFSEEEKKLWPVAQILYLCRVRVEESEELQHEVESAMREYPESMELLKAYGDLWDKKGETEKARKIYADVLRNSNNGVLNLEIIEKVGDIREEGKESDSAKYKIGEYCADQWRMKQFELLSEIHEICVENDLQYSLANDTALYAYYDHCLPPSKYVNTVMMTASNAQRFIEAVEKRADSDRQLDYMKTNDLHIGDDLYYGTLSGAYMNLNSQYHMKNMGMFVRIIVLRANSSSKLNTIVTNALEGIRTANCNVDKIHKSAKRRMIKYGCKTVTKIVGQDKFSQVVFDRIIKDEKNSPKEEYFIKKRKRLRNTTLKTYPSSMLNNIQKIEIVEQGNKKSFYMVQHLEEDFVLANDNFEPDLSNLSLQNSLLMYADANLKADTLKAVIGWDEIRNTEMWNEHLRARKFAKRIKRENKIIASYWDIVLRIDDRIKLWEHYEACKEDVVKAFKEKDYEALDQLLEILDQKVEEYAKKRMGFYFAGPVFDIYYEWLKIRGREMDEESYKELVPEYYYEPIKITN